MHLPSFRKKGLSIEISRLKTSLYERVVKKKIDDFFRGNLR